MFGFVVRRISVNFEFSGALSCLERSFLVLILCNLVFGGCLGLELVFSLFCDLAICDDFAVLC